MINKALYIYNTLSRKKERFKPLHDSFVGMYVCGPTVYGDAHLGHARSAITFDILFRYLKHVGYHVRYVRNITDVGHLINDRDEGEDKLQKKAHLERLEPMEVAQKYTDSYHDDMDRLNNLRPSIEPRATGHIIEQIASIEKIIKRGYAYISNGSVYFDVQKFDKDYSYGTLSGRNIDDLIAGSGAEVRQLEGTSEKKGPHDFALWKKASETHIMRWPSPWSEGFPGWHIECTTMGMKYLGNEFDIHGGGMDLLFPHHECEIAQSKAIQDRSAVRYWLHNNMITINGQKMGKSLNNSILLKEFFFEGHVALDKTYAPNTIRFFILQAHYRSTLDFSNEALQASEKGLKRIENMMNNLSVIVPSDVNEVDIESFIAACYNAMNDDLNTPILIAELFQFLPTINKIIDGRIKIDKYYLQTLTSFLEDVVYQWLGLKFDKQESEHVSSKQDGLIEVLLQLRAEAKKNKDFELADKIREKLFGLGIKIKDQKDKTIWEIIS